MKNRLEDKIRDYLALNLHLISPGLKLIRTEYILPHPQGAGGRIDILAKDEYGVFVIIEIKRSDQAARQALSEIFKYTGLFRNNQGLDETRVRVLVVSTEWNELRLPLSEYAAISPYSVEGIKIKAAPDGSISEVHKIELTQARDSLTISKCHGMYMFERKEGREPFKKRIQVACQQCGVGDFLIFECDYNGGNAEVIYPFGLYFCFASPLQELEEAALLDLKEKLSWEEGLDEPDENFFVAIGERVRSGYDEFCISYPEKLAGIRSSGWSIDAVERGGRFAAQAPLVSDEELISLAAAIEGGANDYIQVFTRPGHSAKWAKLTEDLPIVLEGNEAWVRIVPLVLAEIEKLAPRSSVSISIYNPANLVMTLGRIAVGMHPSACAATLEIVIDDKSSKVLRIINGFICGDGDVALGAPDSILKRIYGGFDHWTMINHFHGTYEFEDAALSAHALTVVVSEWCVDRGSETGPILITERGGALIRGDFPKQLMPWPRWIERNADYLRSLHALIAQNTHGFR